MHTSFPGIHIFFLSLITGFVSHVIKLQDVPQNFEFEVKKTIICCSVLIETASHFLESVQVNIRQCDVTTVKTIYCRQWLR